MGIPMRVEDVRKVGVVGAGVMGTQIGELFAQKGFRVSMVDIDQKALIRSRRQIESKLRNRLFMVPSRISWSLDLYEAVKDVDLVVETVTEDLNLKVRIFAQLDQSTPKHAILVSNSSTFPITWIVDKVSEERRPKCASLHFMNPVGASKIVEVVKGTYTSDETIQVLEALVRKLGKKPIVLKKESPGFIINRVLGAILRESYRLLEEGVASAEEIDEALTNIRENRSKSVTLERDLKEKYEELSARITDIRGNLTSTLKGLEAELKEEVTALHGKISGVQEGLSSLRDSLEGRLDSLTKEINELKAEIGKVESAAEDLRERENKRHEWTVDAINAIVNKPFLRRPKIPEPAD